MKFFAKSDFDEKNTISIETLMGETFTLERGDISKVYMTDIVSFATIIISQDSKFYKYSQIDKIKTKDRQKISEFWFGYSMDAEQKNEGGIECDPLIFLDKNHVTQLEKPRDARRLVV